MNISFFSNNQIKALSLIIFTLTVIHILTMLGFTHWLNSRSNAQLIIQLNSKHDTTYNQQTIRNYDTIPGQTDYDIVKSKQSVWNTKSLKTFDPNKAGSDVFKQFDISEKVISNIMKYREAGGFFNECDDLKKIYGFKSEWLESIKQYCFCDNKDLQDSSHNIYSMDPININLASVDTLQLLKGIGPVLSTRIVKYRNRIGGFHQIEQILEVYGIEDSLYNSIKHQLVAEGNLNRININTATFEDLASHFYIDYSAAGAITKYRKYNGDFPSVSSLQEIVALPDSTFHRIKPYLFVDQIDSIK